MKDLKQIIAEHFDYSLNFDFLDVIKNIIERIDDYSDSDSVYNAIDEGLIYSYDEWTVLKFYCSPTEANWATALDALTEDVFSIVETLKEGE